MCMQAKDARQQVLQTHKNWYPDCFRSLFLSEKLKNDQELQLNYSRRVNRPNFFQLIPYRDYSDPQNQREGNQT